MQRLDDVLARQKIHMVADILLALTLLVAVFAVAVSLGAQLATSSDERSDTILVTALASHGEVHTRLP